MAAKICLERYKRAMEAAGGQTIKAEQQERESCTDHALLQQQELLRGLPRLHRRPEIVPAHSPPLTPPPPPAPPSSNLNTFLSHNANPLTQLADITLAATLYQQQQQQQQQQWTQLASLLLPGILARQRMELMSASISPSCSPSPPPVAPRAVFQPSPFLQPEQSAPEDLRVVSKRAREDEADVDSDGESVQRRASVSSSSSSSRDGSGSGFFPCSDCGKAYSTSSNLARHRQTHRSLEDKEARKCPHCDKTYVSMPAYSMHLRTHNQGCKCPYCGKCFSRPWLLQGHIRTHTGEKPFSCHICNKAFADKSNLRAHIQTHSDTKPFVCHRCNKAFALKSYLYKHEESSCMRGLRQSTKKKARSIPLGEPVLE